MFVSIYKQLSTIVKKVTRIMWKKEKYGQDVQNKTEHNHITNPTPIVKGAKPTLPWKTVNGVSTLKKQGHLRDKLSYVTKVRCFLVT